MKRVLSLVMGLLLLLSTLQWANANTIDFAARESYYAQLCSGPDARNFKTECQAYQQYVNQKALDAQNELQQLREELKDVKANILKYAAQVADYEAQITRVEGSIRATELAIETGEREVAALIKNIAIRQANIDEIDAFIQERMISMQSFVALNAYIDFIVGASDFVDLVRRIEGINEITMADRREIERLGDEIRAFNSDKEELENQLDILQENRLNLERNRVTLKGLQEAVELILFEYKTLEAELMEKEEYIVSNLSEIQNALRAIAQALRSVTPSPGWIRPVKGSFRVSATVWSYPFGGTHLGVDMAAPVGTELVAVANGVVLFSSNSCPTIGFFGNNCGAPGVNRGGNQVYLLVSVNNATYAIIYMHLEQNSPITMGQIVNQGDYVGRNGSSGSSTGPHLHIEVIYLGNTTIANYVDRWNGDLSFGTGWGNLGLERRCDFNGRRAPCRENPARIFGVEYNVRY